LPAIRDVSWRVRILGLRQRFETSCASTTRSSVTPAVQQARPNTDPRAQGRPVAAEEACRRAPARALVPTAADRHALRPHDRTSSSRNSAFPCGPFDDRLRCLSSTCSPTDAINSSQSACESGPSSTRLTSRSCQRSGSAAVYSGRPEREQHEPDVLRAQQASRRSRRSSILACAVLEQQDLRHVAVVTDHGLERLDDCPRGHELRRFARRTQRLAVRVVEGHAHELSRKNSVCSGQLGRCSM